MSLPAAQTIVEDDSSTNNPTNIDPRYPLTLAAQEYPKKTSSAYDLSFSPTLYLILQQLVVQRENGSQAHANGFSLMNSILPG